MESRLEPFQHPLYQFAPTTDGQSSGIKLHRFPPADGANPQKIKRSRRMSDTLRGDCGDNASAAQVENVCGLKLEVKSVCVLESTRDVEWLRKEGSYRRDGNRYPQAI